MKKRTTKKLSKSIGAKIDDASGSGSSEPWWSTNPEFVSLEGEIRGNYGPVHDWGADSTGEALLARGSRRIRQTVRALSIRSRNS